ncbi:MAG: hypothetical protein IPJ94_22790 [Chloroflexi bacterium]|nr:hypothetical protein [Chloroflexota bacterium]
MIRGKDLEKQVYESEHIQQVTAEITANFPDYFTFFAQEELKSVFRERIKDYQKEQDAYREYLNLQALEEYDQYDPNAFKSHTRKNCPIIRRCLMSQDEVMKDYKISFNNVTGRQLLNAVSNIARFGRSYQVGFNDETHEAATTPEDLSLETLNQTEYGCGGVIGYGIQSSLLYGVFPRTFAHRSQNAVWALYFLSGRKDFDLQDGSEFLMVHASTGTCEQNYFYPAELFGFYALHVYRLLKAACKEEGINFVNHYRYIYLSAFCDFIANRHREHINIFKRSSDYVESHWF